MEPNDDKLCPAGTKSVSYTVSNVYKNMSGSWECQHDKSKTKIIHHLEVYGKQNIKCMVYYYFDLIKTKV